MRERTRLVDQGANDFERGLLRSAEIDAPEDRAQRRLLAALGVAAVATVTAESAGAAAGTVAVGSNGAAFVVVKWVAIAVLAGGATVGALHAFTPHSDVAAPSPAVQSTPRSSTRTPPSPLAPAPTGGGDVGRNGVQPSVPPAGSTGRTDPPATNEPTNVVSPRSPSVPYGAPGTARLPETPTTVQNGEPASVPSPLVPTNTAVQTAAPPAAPAPTLAAEVRAIDLARSALRDQRPRDALRALDAYASSFPHGAFDPEATALRVEALIAAGDRAAAERLGEAFLFAHATSPAARQVRALLNR